MSDNATITVFGTTSIAATSPDTQTAIAAALAAIAATPSADQFTWNGTGSPPVPPHPGSSLVLTGPVSADFVIPAGYTTVVIPAGSTAKITGGDAGVTIVGDGFNYTGQAGKVISGSGDSSISDDAANATIQIGSSGNSSVVASGAGAIVTVGDSGHATIIAAGDGDLISTGRGSQTTLLVGGAHDVVNVGGQASSQIVVTGSSDTVTVQNGGSAHLVANGTTNVFNLGGTVQQNAPRSFDAPGAPVFTNVYQGQNGPGGNTINVMDGASVNELVLGAADTVNASAGLSTIFGLSADSVSTGLGSVFFVGGAGASTILGGAANTTVFATTGQQFNVGAAQANVFVGGTAASTINAGAGGGSFFGGTHGDAYNFGTGSKQVFVGLGGSDTLGGSGGTVAPTIFATGAEKLSFTAGTQSVTVVSLANGGSVDMSKTAGSNVVFGGFGGNQTLIGAASAADSTGAATHDTFVVGANAGSTPTAITVENWHSGDVFYLSGFTAADTTTMDSAVAHSLAQGAKGNLSFTLSDNTTVIFLANHPTNFSGNAIF